MPMDGVVGELVAAAVETVAEVTVGDGKPVPDKRGRFRRVLDCVLFATAIGLLLVVGYLALA